MALQFDFNTLLQFMMSASWEQRRDAAEDLGNYGAPEAIPYLIRALSDEVGAVQYAGAVALGKIGTPHVVQALLACLDNPRFRFPAPVLESLGNLRMAEAVPSFIRYLRHPDPHVRAVANSALMVTTGKALGFRATATDESREAAVQRWEQWWAGSAATFQPPGARR
jgi:HEAT repeat protein